jgi:phospholipid transport system substrate-binding protein
MTRMTRRTFSLSAILVLALAVAALPAGVRAAQAENADNLAALEASSRSFIDTLATDAINALTDADIPRDERIASFRALFNERFAVHTIVRFVIGRHWNKATEDEKTEFLGLFERLMIETYVDRFSQYSGVTLETVRAVADKETRASVQSRLIRPDPSQPPVRVDWVVGAKGDVMKVIDMSVEGASVAQTLRADFASIIRQRGAGVAGLIDALKEKLAQIDAG